MTKKTEQAAVEFNEGDRVTVTTAATGGEPASGTIYRIHNGWHMIELDDAEEFAGAKNGIVSARASSLEPLDECDEDETGYGDAEDNSPEGEPGDEEGIDDEEPEEDGDASKMAKALREARQHYTKALRPDGTPTAHSNDLIARVLLESEPLEVCSFADYICEEPQGYHAERYATLNNGQKRMNAGNKIRSHWRKAVELGDKTTMALIMGVLGLDQDDVEGELPETTH